MMCCSLRAAVYFLASNQLYFGVTQVIMPTVPLALEGFGTSSKFLPSLLTVIFCIAYITSGILIFLGADRESSTLLRYGGNLLALSLIYRFFLLGFSYLLSEKLPEGSALYVYNTQVVPIIFLSVIYIFYLSVVFCYHNELVDARFRELTNTHSGLYLYKSPRRHQLERQAITGGGGGGVAAAAAASASMATSMVSTTSFYEEQ